MSDYSAKPSGSLARIGDYDLSSDDSDQNEEEETTPIPSQPIITGTLEVSEIAVADPTPVEVENQSSANPESGAETASASMEEDKDVKADEEDDEEKDDKDDDEGVEEPESATISVESEATPKTEEEVKEESQDDKMLKQTESSSETVADKADDNQDDSDSSADEQDQDEDNAEEEKAIPVNDDMEPSVSSPVKEKVPEVKKPVHQPEEYGDSNSDDSDDDQDNSAEPMDTTEKLEIKPEENEDEDEDEEMDTEEANGTNNQSSSKTEISENPWETPRQKPIDGIVQPRTEPPKGKPTRHTNCLDFVLFTVVKDALKHKHSWPFQLPVDAEKLEIPEYHNVVTKPMDLRTIERRLRNLYYWCAEDAIKDINQLFTNCYAFNPPEYDIYKMAKTLEKQVLSQLTQLPRSEKPAELAEYQRRGMFPGSTPSGKTKGPKQRGRKSARGRKKVSVPRGVSAVKEESVDDFGDDVSSKVDSVNFDDDDDTITEKDVESRAESVQPEPEEPSIVLQPTPKAGKRKAENGEIAVAEKTPAPVTPTPVTPAPPPRKNPNTLIDWKSLEPRWHGKQAEWQKNCSKLLTEIHSVRNKGFAQLFYQPVDPIKLKIFDYLDIITNPMDLHTIKKKLDHKQYAEPEEFEQDMNLMVDNCCKYNPKGSVAHQNALDMKSFFYSRWKKTPRHGADPNIAESYITQNLVVNTDLIEDEKINNYLTAVKAEEKKCAEKLEMLRNMSEGLYTIAMQRREAKLAGNTAPSLAPNQLTQLEKLGINVKTTPVLIPELISPALSVRSSSRAPVPKIIDDIGPSPIKARKISKPRASIASNASLPYTPTGNPRGRKPKKSGRPKKSYSPGPMSPLPSLPPPSAPYVSIYGRKTVGTKEKIELSDKMSSLSQEYVTPILRIIQIGQQKSGKRISSIRSFCEEEVIDFNDVTDELVIELLDYLQMMEQDKPRAERVKQELEIKARTYGLEAVETSPPAKKRKIQKPMRSESPSPSASRAGRSSDSGSESDSSDSEPSRPNSVLAKPKRPIDVSGNSSRASTPAGPSRPPAPSGRHSKSSKPNYDKRTLSESSSSSGSSSESSDSESEPKPQHKKQEPPSKKKMIKRAPPPKKKGPLSILDELLPETNEKKHVPTVTAPRQDHHQKQFKMAPHGSEEEMRMQREQEHNEALRRQAEARRRRAMEDQPVINQLEVMQEFESQYGDFSY